MEQGRQGRGRGGEREGGIPDGLLVGLLGFLLGLTVLVWTATGLAGLFAHGAWPTGVTFTSTPVAMRSLASAPQDLPAAWPSTPPAELSGYGLFWGLAIGELMVLVVLTVFTLGTVARWRAVRARTSAERHAIARTSSEPHGRADKTPPPAPAVETASEAPAPPAPAPPVPEQSVPAAPAPVPAFQPADPAATAAPAPAPYPHAPAVPSTAAAPVPYPPTSVPTTVPGPRGTGSRVLYGDPATRRPSTVQALLDAEGPVLVVTSDASVWAETKGARAKLGPVLVYDPGHLCDTPSRLHWSPTAGCEDERTAAARATALLAPVRPRALIDAAMADTAETLLRCWLHAAAVDGRPFRQVHRWAQGTGAHEPVRILRTHPKAAAGLAGLLESALTAYPERRDIAQQLTGRAFAALSSVHIREACTPNRTDSLALESFVNEAGTLYVVGEPIEDPRSHPGAMPLLTALASDVVEHGRRMAARSSDGRLDPPLTLVLDDVAAVAPLPVLPDLLATGQDQGLPTLVLLRSAEQARARWTAPLPSH
ncbi:type VI secretion protein [Streptomyces sp. PKU-EA00015]|uniref:type IV secretory system conjugative DNA transfer family protein n=1 Tax=Streptomyces sp. PKU-EA00015 TaxID=2748326 RepID=UPI0015A16520|nr:type IV secretory system conjugative DNA transfer family protein [Streptomyces sp. PKU-EA00015]NWF27679.1 type VI secretion protein [Streptomyces sp. PKU-EA00015]